MSFTACMKTSRSDAWSTPQWFFDELDGLFHFTLDVCATHGNAKCKRYFTREDNGLIRDWGKEVCWMNPPYGRQIGVWIKKAYQSVERGATVVCLAPARTDTKWWHDYCLKGKIKFVRGRLRFGDETAPAPFPCAVVIFADPNLWVRRGVMGFYDYHPLSTVVDEWL